MMNSKLVFVIFTSLWLFTAVQSRVSPVAVVAATDQAAAAVAVSVTVSLPLTAGIGGGAAGPVVGVGAAVPGAGGRVAGPGLCAGAAARVAPRPRLRVVTPPRPRLSSRAAGLAAASPGPPATPATVDNSGANIHSPSYFKRRL